jgi:hypothetical protein
MNAIQEFDMVVLMHGLPEHGLQAGDIGAVVHCYRDGKGLEVEFVTGSGETVAVATLERSDVRLMKQGEILHARAIAA